MVSFHAFRLLMTPDRRHQVRAESCPTESWSAQDRRCWQRRTAAVTAAAADGVDVDALAAAVTRQGATVRQMKKDGVTGDELVAAVAKLTEAKAALAQAQAQAAPTDTFDRKAFEDTVVRRMFVVPSFEIHGGVAGLFDLGPPACGLKANIVDTWRKHFVLAENMLEMECTNLTPHAVLKTSGHVDKFTDLMVKDVATGEPFRADKLLEDHIDALLEANPAMPREEAEEHRRVQRQADAYAPDELGAILRKYGIKSALGNDLSEPFPFNLMFKTTIGPEGTSVGYLRPETAQGLFVNFRRLLEYNSGRVPFAAAQIGLGFRNEIAPRNGLLRVREFTMAEIEHFVHPKHKEHPNFPDVADKVLTLFGREDQLGSGRTQNITIGDAVRAGLVNNETLGYFMARTQLFLEKIGMDPLRMRFRQHLATEMAHYAADCWDMEIKTSFGWVECVGHADRACYDLQVHAEKTKVAMVAARMTEPHMETFYKFNGDKKRMGTTFKANQKAVMAALDALADDHPALEAFEAKLDTDGSAELAGFTVDRAMIAWKKTEKMVQEEKFTPSVIEPSFGIGRVLYSLLEHSFYTREGDEQRGVFRFNAAVAPIKCAIFPLSANDAFNPLCSEVAKLLGAVDVATRTDASGVSLGRRYARADEIGVPFAVTVDFQSVEDNTVTLRERDSMAQIRLAVAALPDLLVSLVFRRAAWQQATERFPVVRSEDEEGDGSAAPAAVANGAPTKVERSAGAAFSRPATAIDTSTLRFP
ncbi:hypothetical protein JKP88DRAFT_269141 [Tribonema minus]|uniref:glycine--tRNA ligase n=1 Tax=Tribonema minus TaxID=303371 RepID=A0A836C9B2_9STRA|nr:hypothetical protein JKP88DRAFT_269141 [Tribonema minus]